MKHAFLTTVAVALAIAAVAAPLAGATDKYDGYKSSYPELRAILRHQATPAPVKRTYDGYKSSYPQLRATLAYRPAAPVPTAEPGFQWSDAAIGAGTAAIAIFLIAAGALGVSRRRVSSAL